MPATANNFLDTAGLQRVWGKAKDVFVNNQQALTQADIDDACGNALDPSGDDEPAPAILADYLRKDELGTATLMTDAEFDAIFT